MLDLGVSFKFKKRKIFCTPLSKEFIKSVYLSASNRY